MLALTFLAHAFGQRYELPIPLPFFVFGGAFVVFLSFLLTLPTRAQPARGADADTTPLTPRSLGWALLSLFGLAAVISCGLLGSQEVAENLVPTLFWLVTWIAVPLSCGLVGDWTQRFNPFAHVAKLADSFRIRRILLARVQPLPWPRWLGWWPAVVAFFAIACGELIYNQSATRPAFTASCLLLYGLLSGFAGLIFGSDWLTHGEVFTVLFATWGRLGYWRFGAPGRRGFAGGLVTPFDPSRSRISFTLLLLISVSFDGLLATPAWSRFAHQLPSTIRLGTGSYLLLSTGIFAALAVVLWLLFSLFASLVQWAGHQRGGSRLVLAGLLPSLLPISFGYLLAHNMEYLLVNGQLLFPLLGNPLGSPAWPLHLPFPFNDHFEPNIHLLPSAVYWYMSIAVIVAVHIVAVVLAHRHLAVGSDKTQARRAEYPWVLAMILYTMLSLWLLAQPLVADKTAAAPTPPLSTGRQG